MLKAVILTVDDDAEVLGAIERDLDRQGWAGDTSVTSLLRPHLETV